MSFFEQHIHYKVQDLSLDQKKELMRKAFDLKYNWWVDKLDCRESFARQEIKMSFEEIMGHLTEKAFIVLIHRKEHTEFYPEYLEVGFSSMESPVDYFLWIQVPISEKENFVCGIEEIGLSR